MAETKQRTAGAFDVRVVIATLFFVYGVVLTVMGAFAAPAAVAKSANVNINLYTGIGMVIFAVVFALWAWLRPIVVSRPPSGTTGK